MDPCQARPADHFGPQDYLDAACETVCPLQPACGHLQAMSGVFSIASHSVLQYFPEVTLPEQTGWAHFLISVDAICVSPFIGAAERLDVSHATTGGACPENSARPSGTTTHLRRYKSSRISTVYCSGRLRRSSASNPR